MTEGVRISIERIDAEGRITKGTARQRGVTLDDYRSINGAPLDLEPGGKFVVILETEVYE